MKKLALALLTLVIAPFVGAADTFESDTVDVADGTVRMTFIGHATLMFEYNGLVIHIDPVGREADYSAMPDGDLILITHEHGDHFDPAAISAVRTPQTVIIHNKGTASRIDGGRVLENGESTTVRGIRVDAVPAYNTTAGRERFHPKGRDNGYVLTIGGKRFYIAGDTEDTTEMLALRDIDVAFLPANQPYTMLPEQVVRAALEFRPSILYPYHFGETDVDRIVDELSDVEGMDVRIRDLD